MQPDTLRPMTSVSFTRIFAAAHRVWNDPGKCSNIHGHNYVAEVTIDLLEGGLDEQGFLVPFDAVKKVVDSYDHALILDKFDPIAEQFEINNALWHLKVRYMEGPPSTERFARVLAFAIEDAVLSSNAAAAHVRVTVDLRETAGIQARAVAP